MEENKNGEEIQTAGPGLCQLRSQDGGSNQED